MGIKLGLSQLTLDQKSLDLLESFKWPGNVRELEHCLTRAALRASRGVGQGEVWVRPEHLDVVFSQNSFPTASEKKGEIHLPILPLSSSLISFQKS
jgi:transcriptional regulator with GAF, ATPase, and Fis domain